MSARVGPAQTVAPDLGTHIAASSAAPIADGAGWLVEFGDSHGPAVVLVPGLTDGLAPLSRPGAVERLARVPLRLDRLRALAVSYPTPLPAPCSTRELAAALAVVLDRTLDEPAVLVAHSMGGMVAQHLAADRPDLVRGLVLSATSSRADAGMRTTFARWDALLRVGAFEDFCRDAIDRSFTGSECARRQGMLDEQGVGEAPAAFVTRHLTLSAACGLHDAHDRIGAIQVPALVLAAAADRVIPLAHARRLAAGLPDARLIVYPRLGHGFPDEDPVGYRREVEPFIDRLIDA